MNDQNEISNSISIKVLDTTWVQIRNIKNEVIFSKLMSTNDEYNYTYFSPSYNHYGRWTLTSFVDIEEGKDSWLGFDYTYNFKNTSQLSIFWGSQKGGLVCANGSCVLQPDFEDGFKVTYLMSI